MCDVTGLGTSNRRKSGGSARGKYSGNLPAERGAATAVAGEQLGRKLPAANRLDCRVVETSERVDQSPNMVNAQVVALNLHRPTPHVGRSCSQIEFKEDNRRRMQISSKGGEFSSRGFAHAWMMWIGVVCRKCD
jgi:hypothetical protein